jgi:hypothetical protein
VHGASIGHGAERIPSGAGEAATASIFRDKNRRDIGKSQSMWTDSKMEMPAAQVRLQQLVSQHNVSEAFGAFDANGDGRLSQQVSRFLMGIGSPCLRHCVHGASINGDGRLSQQVTSQPAALSAQRGRREALPAGCALHGVY